MQRSTFHPSVLIVGGPDVDARLDIMQCLRSEFDVSGVGSTKDLQQRFAQAGFSYYSYPLNRAINPGADFYSTYCLWRLFLRLRPKIVHTYDTKPGVWGRLAAAWAHVPIIIGTLPGLGSLYTSDSWSVHVTRAVYQPLQRLACQVSDLTIFQNNDDARQFIRAGIVREQAMMVIPGSGVATGTFAQANVSSQARRDLRERLGIQPDGDRRDDGLADYSIKRVPEFVAAAHELKARYPQIHFLLVGPDDENSVERLSVNERTQLKQTVTWPGALSDIRGVLAISDLFVLPSAYREGIPRVLLEAASMGLPIVTTDSPGCNEVVEDGVNGFLIPVHDWPALAKAIACSIEQPELRAKFGKVSRERAVKRFDLETIAGRTRFAYRSLLAPEFRVSLGIRR